MPPSQPPLSAVLPPLILGTATFNSQYNDDPFAMPTTAIVARALELGITAFDTSPYYGPSETLLGAALLSQQATHPRNTYKLITKVGRVAGSEFDYSPTWIAHSIRTSLTRLHTPHLDLVYCHDVEFVSPSEVLTAITELRRIRDSNGTIKYVGISGYPIPVLCELAEMVLRETGEPLDAVMSYANYTLQNTTLLTDGVERLKNAGVQVVPNASPLGMGLLRSVGVPVGGKGDFHPAGLELRESVAEAAKVIAGKGEERLETLSIRWALEEWAREGGNVGVDITHPDNKNTNSNTQSKIGASVIGVSKVVELEETMTVWASVLDGLDIPGREVTPQAKEQSERRRREVQEKAEVVWKVLGKWKDFAWASPDEGFVNTRKVFGFVEEEVKGV